MTFTEAEALEELRETQYRGAEMALLKCLDASGLSDDIKQNITDLHTVAVEAAVCKGHARVQADLLRMAARKQGTYLCLIDSLALECGEFDEADEFTEIDTA